MIGNARLLNRKARRPRVPTMSFYVGEPEKYEHAQNVRFGTLLDDIASDPAGRGRVPAASPLAMAPAPVDQSRVDIDAAGLYDDAQAGDIDPVIGEAQIRRPAPASAPTGGAVQGSPLAMYRGASAPPVQAPAPAPASATSKPEIADPFEGDADRPDYGRVTARKIAPGTAGDAPGRGDKWLAAARGVGSILMAAGGEGRQAMEAGLEAKRDYDAQEAQYRDWTERNANLERDAAKEQLAEDRYTTDANYNRARDEDAAERAARAERVEGERYRSQLEMQQGDRSYERDPMRRKEGLQDYEARKQIDAKYSPRRSGGGGAGRSQAQRDMAYRSMMDSAAELYPDGVPQNVQNEIALRAMGKDPLGDAAKFTDSLRGDVTAQGARDAAMGQRQAIAGQKAAAQAAEIDSADQGLANLEAALVRKLERKETTLPGTTVGSGLARGVGGLAKQVGIGSTERPVRRKGESDESWNKRFGDYQSSNWGPSGFSEDDATINSFGALYGRALYYDSTQNSANLQSEAKVADETVRSNGTVDGMLQQVRNMRARLRARKESGRFITRDAQGNAIEYDPAADAGAGTPSGGAPAQPGRYVDPNEM